MKSYEKNNIPDGKSIWRVLCSIAIFAVITVLISIQIYRFGSAYRYWNSNRIEKELRIKEIAGLEKQQKEMNRELNNLKYNILINERLARGMGYTKPDEIVYKFKSEHSTNPSLDH